jgi:hypothetical protein
MSYNNQTPQYQQSTQDVVSGQEYQYLMTNFRLAHEKVEQQRRQLEEQERQVSQLKSRIALLEGNGLVGSNQSGSMGTNTVDDFSIKVPWLLHKEQDANSYIECMWQNMLGYLKVEHGFEVGQADKSVRRTYRSRPSRPVTRNHSCCVTRYFNPLFRFTLRKRS